MKEPIEDTIYIFQELPEGSAMVGEFIWYGWPLEAPHRREYAKVAGGLAAGLGLAKWHFNYVHVCRDPRCDAQRLPEEVFHGNQSQN